MLTTAARRLVFLLGMVILVSCQKEINVDLGTAGTPVPGGTLKMKINGTQWTANNGAAASMIAGFININGLSTDHKSISISLNDTVPGTYLLDQQSFNAAGLSDSLDLGGLAYASNQGQDTTQAGGVVKITNIDRVNKTISGSFQFKAFREFDNKQKVITDGIFDRLPYVTALPPASATDTFRVKIDNVAWTAKSITSGISANSIYVSGSELDLSKLAALSIPSNVVPGTYNIDALAGIYVGVYSPVSATIMTAISGKIVVLEHNRTTRRVRASFNFAATDFATQKSAQLTEGYFSVVYQ